MSARTAHNKPHGRSGKRWSGCGSRGGRNAWHEWQHCPASRRRFERVPITQPWVFRRPGSAPRARPGQLASGYG